MNWEKVVRNNIKKILSGESGHDYEHTLRVYDLCIKLGKLEGADVEVLKAASLLHDIARPVEESIGVSHSIKGAEIARNILKETDFPKNKIEKVCRVIRTHRFTEGIEPQETEEKIMRDADRLDALGAIGIARAFIFGGKNGRSLTESVKHFHDKLLKLKDKMYTKSTYDMAVERHKFMEQFLDRLQKEIVGEA
ncbi:MAG: HD domain-containing protein [Candidatus Jordarchaeum sp.]|uniref:HD domain-containing protein n=1 Tax=Candidatus Jordarchaeum sp. TaxID=2823881 RepID=UPI00404ABE6C